MATVVNTDYDVKRAALIAWLKTNASLTEVIFSNQEGGKPTKPFGTIYVLSDNVRFGFDEEEQNYNAGNDVIEKTTRGPRQMTVRVQVFSDPANAVAQKEAADLLNNALLVLETQSERDAFNLANMTILNHTAVNRLDEQLGERWERRAQTDLTILYTGEVFNDGTDGSGNWIETVEVPSEANTNLTIN